MRVGYQTIIWGPRIDDLESVLDAIATAGYQGVEFAQRPNMLGSRVQSIGDLQRMLDERGLALIGLAGGPLRERLQFCGSVRPPYLYVEGWDPELASIAIADGFTLALHAHVFKTLRRLADVERLLTEHPELKFLPDTAHLTIAGDDPALAVRRNLNRVAGVHLKDWIPEWGRSWHQYARGFAELGTGKVKLDAVLQELQAADFSGWLVVEQDSTPLETATSLQKSFDWLAGRGLVKSSGRVVGNLPCCNGPRAEQRRCSPEAELRFQRALLEAGTKELSRCYRAIAAAFLELVPSDLVTIWACNVANDFMSLLAVEPEAPLSKKVLQCSRSFTGVPVEEQTVAHFDLRDLQKYAPREFACPEVIERLGARHMVTVPVFNPGNHNHVRLLITLLPRQAELPVTDEELLWFGRDVARAVDSALDRVCWFAATSADLRAGQSVGVSGFLQQVMGLIRDVVGCEGTSIFLVNDLGDRLEERATTGIEWRVPKKEQFYRKGEGLTGRIWERNEARLTVDARQETDRLGKSAEVVQTPQDSCLLAPLLNSAGQVIGVVRCQNKRAGTWPMFSDDDVAILDAIGEAAVPHLHVLLSEERRAKAMGRVTHELKTPLVAIRSAAQMMRGEFERRRLAVDAFFGYDYVEDVWSWCELMRRLVGNAEFFRVGSGQLQVRAEKTYLMADVIAPAVRQVQVLLHERGFSSANIHYGRFEQIPRLWIDRNHFQQVMFNLLSNAVKYAFRDPAAFSIEIDGGRQRGNYVIWFRDWGTGIADGVEELIFEEGVRGPNAVATNVAGQGFGLWVVREVIEAHGGCIQVTRKTLPTEFTISLPEELSRRGPDKHLGARREGS